MKDPYEILQVSKNAETEVIEAAYRRLARKYHPDANPATEHLPQRRSRSSQKKLPLGHHRRSHRLGIFHPGGNLHSRGSINRCSDDKPCQRITCGGYCRDQFLSHW